MKNDHCGNQLNGISRLLSAVESATLPEIDRIAQVTINRLRTQAATGLFDEVAARHMWDEYCWVCQEGPFDEDFMGMGSISGNWNSTGRSLVTSEIEILPRHLQIFLSAYASKFNPGTDECDIGSVSFDAMESVIMDKLVQKATQRAIELIGPYRGEVIGYEVSSEGIVCSAISRAGLLTEILATHVDTLIDSEADVSKVALELIDEYMSLIRDEAGASPELSELLDHFEGDIKVLLKEKDVLPELERMQGELLDALDS